MYRKTLTLLQHTPLIHFQGEQRHATLRATEAKPKLDRYLIKYAFGGNLNNNGTIKRGGNAGAHDALDYSMQLFVTDARGNRSSPINRNDKRIAPMFFGNMGNDYHDGDKTLIRDNKLTLILQTPHRGLMETILAHVVNFFAETTFGMRSSKGYGSFTVDGHRPTVAPRFSFDIAGNDWQQALKTIELFYKSVRGGINGVRVFRGGGEARDFYMKPMIFVYAVESNVQWEKKTIKESADAGQVRVQQRKHEHNIPENERRAWPLWNDENQKLIVRDLLGLSTDQSWKSYRMTIGKEDASTDDNIKKIKRFASPWTFKPEKLTRGYRIKVYVDDIPESYLNASFKLLKDKRGIGEYPMWSGFNMDTLIDKYLTAEQFKKSARSYSPQGDKDYDKLLAIYRGVEQTKRHAQH